jgi:uncharacterized protein (DUF1778 family)
MENDKPLKRRHRVTLLLNDEEKKLIERYISNYKVKNSSRFMREAIVRTALKRLDEDRPTLFD